MAAPDSSAGGFRKADDRRASASTGGSASGPPGANGCSTTFCSIASPWVSPIPMRFSGCSNALVPANPMPEAWPSTSPRSRAFPRKAPERSGGQAVVADTFHNHSGGLENADTVKQSHAAGAASQGMAMLGKDTEGNGVPIASREREAAMQDARRD